MAHIGKEYKVHFRRDLCPNCTNYRFAFPECLRVAASWWTGTTTPTNYAFGFVLAYPTSPPRDFPLVWETNPITLHGRTFTWEVQFDEFDDAVPSMGFKYSVLDATGIVASGRGVNSASGVCSGWNGFSSTVMADFDPAFWGDASGTWQGVLNGFAGWSLYP